MSDIIRWLFIHLMWKRIKPVPGTGLLFFMQCRLFVSWFLGFFSTQTHFSKGNHILCKHSYSCTYMYVFKEHWPSLTFVIYTSYIFYNV